MRLGLFLSILCVVCTACPSLQNTVSREPYGNSRQRLIPDNIIYESHIKTVQFYPGPATVPPNYKAVYPVIYVNEPQQLTLEFDELVAEDQFESNFYVDIINCDVNWRPSNVLPIEFYEGFTQDPITLYQQSEFTKRNYIHYTHSFPQENEYFKIPGNYILKVYRNNSNEDLVLSRRFIVADRRIPIISKYELSDRLERQELRDFAFEVRPTGLNIVDPTFELKIFVLQNFRWDNAYKIGRPRFYGNGSFEYFVDFNKAFRGGNEFRWHDIRSMRLYSRSVQDINEDEDFFYVRMFADEPRKNNSFTSFQDRNGIFSIERDEWNNPAIQADYVLNSFYLNVPAKVDGELYVFGSFSDWQMKPENQLQFNEAFSRYERDILLKQGIYDYQYVIKDPNGEVDDRALEGSHFETENFYNILVYYKGPSDRTDRLLGFLPLNYIE